MQLFAEANAEAAAGLVIVRIDRRDREQIDTDGRLGVGVRRRETEREQCETNRAE
jgi:hypothetical protein